MTALGQVLSLERESLEGEGSGTAAASSWQQVDRRYLWCIPRLPFCAQGAFNYVSAMPNS